MVRKAVVILSDSDYLKKLSWNNGSSPQDVWNDISDYQDIEPMLRIWNKVKRNAEFEL